MVVKTAAALSPPERQAVATLAVIYAVRMLGLFLLLPVLALHAGSLPRGTPLLAGLAVGAYGLTQALMQIPFGVWSDSLGRRPLIVAGLLLHIGGSALGYFAATAWTLVIARAVQGLGAVSGPVMALLADRTRAASRTRAMAFIGISIGISFVVSLVAGPVLAGAIGVSGIFALIGGLGLVALALILFAVPKEAEREIGQGRKPWRSVLTRHLLPHYSGIFVLHLSLTATFIAVPHALRDAHGMAAADHWQFYLAVFASSLLLTVPMLLWSERSNRPARTSVIGGLLLAVAQVALALCYLNFMAMAVAVVIFFGAFNFLEARLPSSLSEAAGEDARGAALGVFSTCQFAGAFAGGILGGGLLGSAAGIPGVFLLAGLAAAGWLTVAGRSESP
ncbi:MAG: MFS transporter [Gammaproteobacteria bacterium]|nr:MFS transporter [Gammaproteobacteria bacterium]